MQIVASFFYVIMLAQQDGAALPNKPMLPLVVDRCPVEYCCTQTWVANRAVTLYSEWRKSRKPIGKIDRGQTARTLEHVTITRKPGLMRALRESEGLKVGDVIPVYIMHGEGIYSGWLRGDWVTTFDSGFHCSDKNKDPDASFCWEKLIVYDWWVRVRTVSGQTGWIRDSEHFETPDTCD